ncbi:hypothetical protein SVIOM74S_00896 [Streptomyces violarus]
MPRPTVATFESSSKRGNISCASWAPLTRGERLGLVDQALVDELGGDAERRARGALADPGLEHPQHTALDGELDVAEVLVVVLQRLHDLHELLYDFLSIRSSSASGTVLRMPATTSSPWAFWKSP